MLRTTAPKFIIIRVAVAPLCVKTARRKSESLGNFSWTEGSRIRELSASLQVQQVHFESHGNLAQFVILDVKVGCVPLAFGRHFDLLLLGRHGTQIPLPWPIRKTAR